MMLDTSKEFTLDNAVAALNDTLIVKPTNNLVENAVSHEDAVSKIFGTSMAAA